MTPKNAKPSIDDYKEELSEVVVDSTEGGIPKEQRKLVTAVFDRQLSDIIAEIERGDIVLNPDYQRNYLWKDSKASLLIESILLNVPIPVIYMAEDEDLRRNVIDGLQRLNSLYRFFNNEFKLNGLEVLNELNKQQYSTLDPKAKRILNYALLRIIVIKNESNPEIKYDIFTRLNQGAVSLNEQELRNCLYRGRLNLLLKRISKVEDFMICIGRTKDRKKNIYPSQPRLLDEEFALRLIALSVSFDAEKGKLIIHRKKMDKLLNEFMEENKNMAEADCQRIEGEFCSTFSEIRRVIGKRAFRRIADGNVRANRALGDVIYYAFNERIKNKMEVDSLHDIHARIEAACADSAEVAISLKSFTSEPLKIEERLKLAHRIAHG